MLAKNEVVALLEERDASLVEALLRRGDAARKKYVGDAIHLRGVIEFSNHCRRNCLYCGLRSGNRSVVRYRMQIPEIMARVREVAGFGLPTVVLQSGEDPAYGVEELCSLVSGIKKELGLAVTLSIGERTREEYARLRDAGVDRYLLRFETSDPALFAALKPDSRYEERFRCLRWLRTLGYQVGSGNMVGLPGQSMESIAEDILAFRELGLDMVGLGPFISHPQTPLRGTPGGTLELVLRVTALSRIVTRTTHIPATTATGTINPEGRERALQCGANVLMPNLTPMEYREHYQIYPGKICIHEHPYTCRYCVETMAVSLGRTIARGPGHSLRTGTARGDGTGPGTARFADSSGNSDYCR